MVQYVQGEIVDTKQSKTAPRGVPQRGQGCDQVTSPAEVAVCSYDIILSKLISPKSLYKGEELNGNPAYRQGGACQICIVVKPCTIPEKRRDSANGLAQ